MTNPRLRALPPAQLAVIALLVVGGLAIILFFALNVGLFGPTPSPTTRPSGVPSAIPSASALSPGPTSGGSATTPPSGEPATLPPTLAPSLPPDAAYLLHVPEPIRPTCTLEGSQGSVVQTANCTADGGALTIAYSQYDTPESLTSTFTDLRRGAQIEPDSGRCEDPATWPAEGVYSVGGEVVGRWLCLDGRTGPTIFWTDTRLNILAQLVGQPPADYARLVAFWTNEAGPVP